MNTLQKLYKMQDSDVALCDQAFMNTTNFSSLSEYEYFSLLYLSCNFNVISLINNMLTEHKNNICFLDVLKYLI